MSHCLFIKPNYGLAVDVCYNCVLLRVQTLAMNFKGFNHVTHIILGSNFEAVLSELRVRDILDPAFDDRLRLCSINILTLSCIAAASSNVSGRL